METQVTADFLYQAMGQLREAFHPLYRDAVVTSYNGREIRVMVAIPSLIDDRVFYTPHTYVPPLALMGHGDTVAKAIAKRLLREAFNSMKADES